MSCILCAIEANKNAALSNRVKTGVELYFNSAENMSKRRKTGVASAETEIYQRRNTVF